MSCIASIPSQSLDNRDPIVLPLPWSSASPHLTIVRQRPIKPFDWRGRCSAVVPMERSIGFLDFVIVLNALRINPDPDDPFRITTV
jgi:hypothetical protein